MNVGRALKELRKEKGLTQIELGKKIGLSSQYISDVERDRNTPTDKTIKKILELFDIEYVDFLIDYCGVKRETASEPEPNTTEEYYTLFDLLNEENQKQATDFVEFLISKQRSK